MKGITVYQPQANLIIIGEKKIETRPRKTNIRGTIFIHAGKVFGEHNLHSSLIEKNEPYELGAIIGTVEIVDCIQTQELKHTISDVEVALGNYENERYGWVLENPVKVDKPIPARGQQGWWNFEI